ncbi:MAG: hypothetical protein QOI95_2555 [Acidimicrobiaceae bacterium]
MEVPEYVAALHRDGDLMAKAAGAVAPDTSIPTCPEWTMRDLVLHQGQVHRWAAANVARPSDEPADAAEATGPAPDDPDLVAWFRDGHQTLIDAIESADPDVACWTFMAAPSPLVFWARRQCHETGMHRADAESASGPISAFAPGVAADGIDELLRSFITRPGGRLKSEVPRTLLVRATDTSDEWLVRISDRVETERTGGDADCAMSGLASDLHLFLWNRATSDALAVDGDRSLLDLWRDSVTIRWR